MFHVEMSFTGLYKLYSCAWSETSLPWFVKIKKIIIRNQNCNTCNAFSESQYPIKKIGACIQNFISFLNKDFLYFFMHWQCILGGVLAHACEISSL